MKDLIWLLISPHRLTPAQLLGHARIDENIHTWQPISRPAAGSTFSPETCPPKSRSDIPSALKPQRHPRATLPPTFLFLQSSNVKDPTTQKSIVNTPTARKPQGQLSRSRGSIEFSQHTRHAKAANVGPSQEINPRNNPVVQTPPSPAAMPPSLVNAHLGANNQTVNTTK